MLSIIPRVDYNDYAEYDALRKQLQGDYMAMVTEGLELKTGRIGDMLDETGSLTAGMLERWERNGLDLWLRFTKQQGSEWCAMMSKSMALALDTTCFVTWRLIEWKKNKYSESKLHGLLHELLMDSIEFFLDSDSSIDSGSEFWERNVTELVKDARENA